MRVDMADDVEAEFQSMKFTTVGQVSTREWSNPHSLSIVFVK